MKKSKCPAIIAVVVILCFAIFALPLWAASKADIDKEKADIRKMSRDTLNGL